MLLLRAFDAQRDADTSRVGHRGPRRAEDCGRSDDGEQHRRVLPRVQPGGQGQVQVQVQTDTRARCDELGPQRGLGEEPW